MEVDKDGLSGNPMFNNEVTEIRSHLLQDN